MSYYCHNIWTSNLHRQKVLLSCLCCVACALSACAVCGMWKSQKLGVFSCVDKQKCRTMFDCNILSIINHKPQIHAFCSKLTVTVKKLLFNFLINQKEIMCEILSKRSRVNVSLIHYSKT